MFHRRLLAPAVAIGVLACAGTASAAPPANDDFERAAALAPDGGTATGTFDEATRQADEPAHGVATLWFTVRPTTTRRMAAELPRTDYRGAPLVYTGESLSTLHLVARPHDDDAPRAPFDAQAGQTYRIAVTLPYESSESAFTLRVRPAPMPANDAFADARRVRVPGRYTGNLADATRELGEPAHPQGRSPQHSVWYRFTARRTGRLSVQAVGPDCDTPVAVYTGSRVESLHQVGAGRGTVRFRARRGRAYRVAVDCAGATLGDYELTISDGSIAGKGVALAVDPEQTVASVRSSGLHVKVTTRRRVHVGLQLLVTRATARRLGLDSRVLGGAGGTLDYNQGLPATLRLSGAAARALDGEESLSAVVRLTLLKTDAPNRVLTVPARLGG